jgi:hypothetical protein
MITLFVDAGFINLNEMTGTCLHTQSASLAKLLVDFNGDEFPAIAFHGFFWFYHNIPSPEKLILIIKHLPST